MPALFDQGFFVREPAWHGMGVVLPDYPGRAEAMTLAGHDFKVLEFPVEIPGRHSYLRAFGFKALLHGSTCSVLNVVKDSYEVIQNETAWDIADMLFDQGFQYETGITLDGGKVCAITLKLDEPIHISGDDSAVLPFGCLSWSHDGTGALKVRSGSIRQVCANTVSASEAEGKKLGTDYTFRHTRNVADRIEDAKEAIKGVRAHFNVYREAMEALTTIAVTPAQRDLFVSTIIGDRGQDAVESDRVRENIQKERTKILSLFMGETIPEAHKLTAYGLHLAGGEYFDHLRGYRSQDSYVKRTLLADNPAKANLVKTIREVIAA